MTPNPAHHTLILTTRTNSRYDGECSCGKLTWRNKQKRDIRDEHDAHVQRYLGPKDETRKEVNQ